MLEIPLVTSTLANPLHPLFLMNKEGSSLLILYSGRKLKKKKILKWWQYFLTLYLPDRYLSSVRFYIFTLNFYLWQYNDIRSLWTSISFSRLKKKIHRSSNQEIYIIGKSLRNKMASTTNIDCQHRD